MDPDNPHLTNASPHSPLTGHKAVGTEVMFAVTCYGDSSPQPHQP